MLTIPVTTVTTADGPCLMPSNPLPADAIAVTCDGTNYTVYEPGDTVPAQGGAT